MKEITVNIAQDFSKYPGGRYRADGEFSGERFRDDLPDRIRFDLDGPWNTLEEAEEYGKQFFSSPQTRNDQFCVIKRGKFSIDGSPLAIMIEANPPIVAVFVYQDGFWRRDDGLVPVEQQVMEGGNS